MDSASLKTFGFEAWHPFNRAGSALLIAGAPATAGVYAIRCGTSFPRVSGVSDILYVGKAGNRDGLQMRLRQYFHPGPTQTTNQRLLARCGDSADYEVSYVACDSPPAAAELESEILHKYLTAHHELPPENRALPSAPARVPSVTPHVKDRAPKTERPKTVMNAKMPTFTAVWNRIQSHAGRDFMTVTGKPFTYVVAHGAVRPSRTNRLLPQSDFEKALARVPLNNTSVVQDLQGPSFVYAILMDERIRAGEW